MCVTGSSGLCPRDEWVSQAAHAGQKPQANVIASNVPLTNTLLLPDAIYHCTHTSLNDSPTAKLYSIHSANLLSSFVSNHE